MPLPWGIPRIDDEPLAISIEPGSRTFIVGTNGSGKSALIQHAVTMLGSENVKRISAHRQTWLESSEISLTAQSRREFAPNLVNQEREPSNRWQDWNPEMRNASVLFDLTAKENSLARRFMAHAYEDDQAAIQKLAREEQPIFDQLNSVLSQGGFPIQIENAEGESIRARHKRTSEQYGIERMSDGERNAVILAANVLTVDSGITILIDEPERHLHRSIITPFLSALIEERRDCAFVISTHDVSLPPVGPDATVLIVSSCQWQGDEATAWDIKTLQGQSGLPEDLKRAILGARRQVLFVEGKAQGKDIQLYNLLFPEALVIPSSSCEEVITAVRGLRNATQYHDVEAFGLIDGDNREKEDIDGLKEQGIYALNEYSVESLYFCSDSMNAVADRQAQSLGGDSSEMLQNARKDALQELSQQDVSERMAARRCEKQVQIQARLQMPKWRCFTTGSTHSITLNTGEWYAKELSIFNSLLENEDLDTIIARYPVRHSRTLGLIVRAFDLTRDAYERTLLARLRSEVELADSLRGRIGSLSELLHSGP